MHNMHVRPMNSTRKTTNVLTHIAIPPCAVIDTINPANRENSNVLPILIALASALYAFIFTWSCNLDHASLLRTERGVQRTQSFMWGVMPRRLIFT
jgi:hypothetical protein